MSAELTAAGMFPPSGNETWNNQLNWQPIPIHTRNLSKEYFFGTSMYCPRHDQLFTQSAESAEFIYYSRDFVEFLEKNTGKEIPTPMQMMFVLVTLQDEQDKGLM